MCALCMREREGGKISPTTYVHFCSLKQSYNLGLTYLLILPAHNPHIMNYLIIMGYTKVQQKKEDRGKENRKDESIAVISFFYRHLNDCLLYTSKRGKHV